MEKNYVTCDGNTAAANIAYAFSEVAAIYPITPSSPMGELAEEWAAKGKKNIFGESLQIIEMQSEGGAAGAIHGSLTGGALTTTFTASQGLLLMLPNMFKIAGEMLPTVFHVAARSLACQALSIFGDHSDVMETRGTGFALLSSGNVQEVQDMAVIAHLSTLESKVPFLHFFDGFRTSHEVQKIEEISYDSIKSMLYMKNVEDFRAGSIKPEAPYVKVGAENPDVYFQGRESVNKFYAATPEIVKKYMRAFEDKTGRKYGLFEYIGDSKATKIIISMGSSVDTIDETINYLVSKGEKVGAIKVRLYRPFSVKDFIELIPETVKKIAVLDRTKEPGSVGEPLYLDVVASLQNKGLTIIGGRYGLSSKEFTPSMVKAVYDHLDGKCFHGFTVGINDDVTHTSIKVEANIETEQTGVIRCKFWGYGSDGTVSANKNSIKIIGEGTDMNVQGYFEYDSKKSGGITVSHLRFGNHKIQSQYLLTEADFVALHKPAYIGRYDILEGITPKGTFLLNCEWKPEDVFENLTESMQNTIIKNEIKVYCIDASKIAHEVGLKDKINTIMQAVFFKISGVLPEEEAIDLMKKHVQMQFARKGQEIIDMNFKAIDSAISGLFEVPIPKEDVKFVSDLKLIPDGSDDFIKNIVEPIMRKKGDLIPVSAMPINGAVPTGTNALEKRGIAYMIPEWQSEKCIQCGQCSFVCPHAAIRTKQINPDNLKDAPSTFTTIKSTTKNDRDLQFKVQVYPEDCVGCNLCAEVCPAKGKALVMKPLQEQRDKGENENQKFFSTLPEDVTDGMPETTLKGSQFKQPLFEFSGACGGCGETPYIKLVTQLFGDRMIIANATGCSSIFSGTFATTPFCKNKDGKGPSWANSLFEDNAEYGFGMRLAVDSNRSQLKSNIEKIFETGTTVELERALKTMIEVWDKVDSDAKLAAMEVCKLLPEALSKVYGESEPTLKKINELKDYLVDKSVWIIGGDGWAYDIGFGGLDHVIAQGKNVNILVLDTEVYSNTGGQASKSTPRAATAKFAISGKKTPKKNLGYMMMSYGEVYVASVSMGANRAQVVKAMVEAEKFDGPSIIIAYSPCIAHGFNMGLAGVHEKKAVDSGYWPLYRYDPVNGLQWESPEPSIDFKDYILEETRYKALQIEFPDLAEHLFDLAKIDSQNRHKIYKNLLKKD